MTDDSTRIMARGLGGKIFGLVASVLVLAACSSGSTGGADDSSEASGPLKDVTLTLNFLAAGPNSGFMLAKEKGYYKEAGLNVTILEGQGSATTASLVAQGNSEFGFADAPSAMAVRSKGGKLKIIAPVLQTNGFSVMSLKKSDIKDVSDLKGKSLAVQPGTAQAALLDPLLKANGLSQDDLKIINIDPSALVGSLLQGSVDAIAAGGDAQGVQLEEQGAEINQVFYKDAGVPSVGLSLITSESELASDPDTVKKFVAASLKGWDETRKAPNDAAAAVAKQFPQAGNAATFEKQLKIDIPLLCAKDATTLGNPPTENWSKTFELLTTYQGLPTTPPITDYYTTDYVSSSAPKC